MAAYFNEIDPFAAAWLRNLISAGHIAPGDVDERSILDVRPDDLRGYSQCHFFAGIGGWSLALRLAGWADGRSVWTGSCPCQPFSAAGKGAGFDDARHLWPAWFNLIRECGPGVVFGEQIAAPLGLKWLDLVHSDMENAGYAFAALDLCSAGFGAPHIRQRLGFVGHARSDDVGRVDRGAFGAETQGEGSRLVAGDCSFLPGPASPTRIVADANDAGSQGRGGMPERADQCATGALGMAGGLADADSRGRAEQHVRLREKDRDPSSNLPEITGRGGVAARRSEQADGGDGGAFQDAAPAGPTNGVWRDADWLLCRDGKWRPVEPGTFPLAARLPRRMGSVCANCGADHVWQDDGVSVLRGFAFGNEGREPEEVLRRGMLSLASADSTFDQHEHGPLQGAEGEDVKGVRAMRGAWSAPRSPQGQERSQRRSEESGDALRGLPSRGASERDTAILMRRLFKDVSGGVASQSEQNMFCRVCERVGAHFITEEVGPSRVGRLRAYGNAINPHQFAEFIRAYSEHAALEDLLA